MAGEAFRGVAVDDLAAHRDGVLAGQCPGAGQFVAREVACCGDPFERARGSGDHGLRSRWSRLRVAELAITDRLDRAMAAPAMIGFKNPAAAMGIAAVL